MRLVDLHPCFMIWGKSVANKHHGRQLGPWSQVVQWGGFEIDAFWPVPFLSMAHCVWYDCPKCTIANGGPRGTHRVRTIFAGSPVPPHIGVNLEGKTVRWQVASGSGFNDLSLSPSILLQGGCGWHGFITNGEVSLT